MTVKDQTPSFPTLVSFMEVMHEVAHGTSNYHLIGEKYYSIAESRYPEELATAKILDLLREGQIRATGRLSRTKKGSATRWEAQQYKQHSQIRTYIDANFWRSSTFVKSGFAHRARAEGEEYVDILLVFDDCLKHLAEELAAHRDTEESHEERAAPNSEYSTPYIDLMWQAIDHFEISRENQPIKESLVEWLLTQKIAGQNLSRSTAAYLASFVRLPESRAGGNRPWNVRAQQNHKKDA